MPPMIRFMAARKGDSFMAITATIVTCPYAFIGEVPVWAELRTSHSDASKGSLRALQAIVAQIRRRCPHARIIVRGDSGFCREALMA